MATHNSGRSSVPLDISLSGYSYNKPLPHFQTPQEIGYYSIDGDKQFHDDNRQLKIFYPPRDFQRCEFDLRKDSEKTILPEGRSTKFLDNLLHWIGRHEDRLLDRPTEFVCRRGLLTKLMCLPYEKLGDLMLGVIKFKGKYYMSEFETEDQKRQNESQSSFHTEMIAIGHTFEKYVTADKATGAHDTSSPVNANEGYYTVVHTRLGSHSLVYSAEVDCEDTSVQSGNKFIELKTCKILDSDKKRGIFNRFKVLKWWAQSTLAGIANIVCGFRGDDGVVRQLKNFPVKDMPTQQQWKPNVCFNFLKEFLDLVTKKVIEDNERCAYVFHWRAGYGMTCERRIDDEFSFLPQWYTSSQ